MTPKECIATEVGKGSSGNIREMQREFVRRFSPARFIVLDVEHSMEPLIPERIPREIERVIVATADA